MTVVFLHGLGQTAQSWKLVLEGMDSGEFLCPELWDLSGREEKNYPALYEGFVRFCEGIEQPFCLCGLSLGAVLALQYAQEHPEKVGALALIAPQYAPSKLLLQVQNMLFHLMPQKAFQQMGAQKREILTLTSSMMELDLRGGMGRIHCPTLLLCGEKDRANRKAALELQKYISGAELRLIGGAGHEPNAETPEKLGTLLNEFFGAV